MFRFKDQEKLHETLIDDGLAKIYQSHLEIARAIAAAEGVELVCKLLDGKPYQAILCYVRAVAASLLLVGKTGIHADPELDIGGTAENLMRLAPCHVWLGTTGFTPPLERIAHETIKWTEEAEKSLQRVPGSVRAMVRSAILRFTNERGHTVITVRVVDEATAELCPHFRAKQMTDAAVAHSDDASTIVGRIEDQSANGGLRAEKKAPRERQDVVTPQRCRFTPRRSGVPEVAVGGGALARVARVPERLHRPAVARVEVAASKVQEEVGTPAMVEEIFEEPRRTRDAAMTTEGNAQPSRQED